jgi:UDP-glucose 4-epimerase
LTLIENNKTNTMHILICGGAGYIGSHMAKILVARGNRVTIFDNLSTGHREAVQWGPLIEGDLLEPGDIENALQAGAYDVVMHFSAKSLVGESVSHPDRYYLNNVVGTINLLNALVRHRIDKFIFSSSAAVFGNPEYTPIDEQHPTRPINPYGKTKLMVESLLADYDHAYGLRSVSLRYFNAAGADPDAQIGESHDPETHLIPNVLMSILKNSGNALKVFGKDYDTPDGTCVRDYIHVNDLCDAHLRSLDHLTGGGKTEIFNLGNGQGFSVLEVIQSASLVTGKEIRYSVVERRAGDPPVLLASANKARQQLNWEPRYTELGEIIETAWRWHREMKF